MTKPIFSIGLCVDQENLLKASTVSDAIKNNIPGIQNKLAIILVGLLLDTWIAINAAKHIRAIYTNMG